MNTMRQAVNRRSVGRIIVVLLATLFCFIAVKDYLAYSWAENLYKATAFDTLEDRLASLGNGLENTYTLGRADMSSLSGVLEAYDASGADAGAYQNALASFAKTRPEYYMLRYEPLGGKSGPRLTFGAYAEGTTTAADENAQFAALQKGAGAYQDGQVFISALTPYKSAAAQSLPVIYSMSPVIVSGKVAGFLEAVVSMNPSFQDIRHASRPDEWIALIDASGNYIVDGGSGEPMSERASDDYPAALTDRLFSDKPDDSFVYQDRVFSYRHIDVPGFVEVSGAHPYWTLVSVARTDAVFHEANGIRSGFIVTLSASALLIGLISFLVIMTACRPAK